jgi:DNA-binding NarL/FixJ family response regulator
MTDIVVVSPSPLWAGGVVAALSGVAEWQVVTRPAPTAADALVLHVRDAAQAATWHATLPAQQPAVLLGDDLRELARRSAVDARPLALLAPDATPERLRAAVAAVLQGLSVRVAAAQPAGPTRRAAGALPPADHDPLTPRELEVFELLGKGLSNPDIGGVLGISSHTAKFHVGQILAKVGAATRAEAVRTGLQLGVIGL